MSEDFLKFMQYLRSAEYRYPLPAEYADILSRERLAVHHAQSGELLVENGAPLAGVYLLLHGCYSTEKYSPSGKLLTSASEEAVQIFGLFEALHPSVSHHTATIRCITPCAYLCIPVRPYLRMLESSAALSMIHLQYLSVFIHRALFETDTLLLHNIRDRILLYLYNYSCGGSFPVKICVKKETLAQSLNINLRTLYRHLDALYRQGLIASQQGKIVISAAQHQAIRRLLRAAQIL